MYIFLFITNILAEQDSISIQIPIDSISHNKEELSADIIDSIDTLFIDKINNLELLDRNVLDQEEKQIIQKIIRNLKLTETQQYQLLELSENRKKLKNNLEVLEVFLSQKTNNKKERNELFNAIREQISS